MIFSPSAVANIISAVLTAHLSIIAPAVPFDNSTAFDVMFFVAERRTIEAIKVIRNATGAPLRPCLYAVKAVYAYMGVPYGGGAV